MSLRTELIKARSEIARLESRLAGKEAQVALLLDELISLRKAIEDAGFDIERN